MAILPRSFPPGGLITSTLIDAILRELWRWRGLQSSSPIDVSNADGAAGEVPPTIWFAEESPSVPGRVSGGITAKAGNTPGTGKVVLQSYNGTSLSDGATVQVLSNFSAAVADGTNCMVGRDAALNLWLISCDCPTS